MKTICRKTGITLLTAGGFSRWATVSDHPIFDLSLESLLKIAAIEWSPSMPEIDKRLLLLAIASNCEILKWADKESDYAPAMPSISIIESSISKLIQIAGWIDWERENNRSRIYPTYLINTATCNMPTFPDMLQRIIDTRYLTAAEERKAHRLVFLETAATNLASKCRIGDTGKESALLRVTAEWALAVTSDRLKSDRVTTETQQDWIKMLQTSPSKLRASKFSITDVHELRDFMLDYLPHGSIIAYEVLAHLNRLIECNVVNDVDQGDILKARVLINASLEQPAGEDLEPQRAAFSDLLSYAKAKANWMLRRTKQEAEAAEALKRAAASARAAILERKANEEI